MFVFLSYGIYQRGLRDISKVLECQSTERVQRLSIALNPKPALCETLTQVTTEKKKIEQST